MILKLGIFYLLIISFICISRTNSQPSSESHVIEVDLPNQEEMCLYINLSGEDYIKLEDGTIFWKLINNALNVLYYDTDKSPIVCAPVDLIYKDARSNCSKLALGKWAYYMKENKDITVELGIVRKDYKAHEYIIDENTGKVQIQCFEGEFMPCRNDSNMLKLALTGSTLKKFMTTKPSLQLYGKIYEENYVEYSNRHEPRVCFASNSTHYDKTTCPRATVEKDKYQLLNNESIFLIDSGTVVSPSRYIVNHDGRLLICIDDFITTESNGQPRHLFKMWFTLIGVTISFVCLFLHTLAFIAFRDLRTYSRQLILGLAVSLMFADLFYLLRFPASLYVDTCRLVGVLTLFFYLSSFFWMVVIGFHLNQVFTQSQSLPNRPETQRRRLLMYAMFTWGLASFIMFINVLVDQLSTNNDFQSHFDEKKRCWISRNSALLLFFATPLIVVLIISTVFFFMIVYKSRKIFQFTNCHPLEKHKRKFREYCSLFILLELGWIVGLIALVAKVQELEYIFIILTAPQGVYVFVIFTCLALPVRRYMKEQTIDAVKENAVNADTEKASMTSIDMRDKN